MPCFSLIAARSGQMDDASPTHPTHAQTITENKTCCPARATLPPPPPGPATPHPVYLHRPYAPYMTHMHTFLPTHRFRHTVTFSPTPFQAHRHVRSAPFQKYPTWARVLFAEHCAWRTPHLLPPPPPHSDNTRISTAPWALRGTPALGTPPNSERHK